MTTDAFHKAFDTTELALADLVLKVLSDAPNREKRGWEMLYTSVGNVTDDNVEMLAAALGSAARQRLDNMIATVKGSEEVLTHDQAKAAVMATDVGEAIREIIDAADRAGTEASALSKRLDVSLAEKQSDRDVLSRAKDIQLTKAMEGAPVSLLTAMELAKMTS